MSSYYKRLDTALIALSRFKDWTTPKQIQDLLKSKWKLQLPFDLVDKLLAHLHKAGFAEQHVKKLSDLRGVPEYAYKVSLEGLLFLERGGYKNENKSHRLKTFWTVAKIIAAFANASIIIYLGYTSIVVSDKSNSLEKKIEQLEQELKKANDSLAHVRAVPLHTVEKSAKQSQPDTIRSK